MTESNRDSYAPSAHTDSPPPVMPADSVSRGARIAGMLLIANVFLVVGEHLLLASRAGKSSPLTGMLPAILDVIIGASLLHGLNKYRTWAIARVVLGALFFVAIQASQGDWLTTVMQLMVSGALLGLLLGDAPQPRIIMSCAVFGLYVLLDVAGLAAVILTGTDVTGAYVVAPASFRPAPAP